MPDAGLAARIADLALSTPVECREQARLTVLDTIAVGLAGGNEPAPQIVRGAAAAGLPTDPIVWHGRRPAALNDCVLANAVAAHALDYDCLIPSAFVQPGAVLIPGLVALAERDGCSGAALVDAVCRGVAVLGALGVAVGHTLHTAGWHPTTVLGVVASAAAAACLLDLGRVEIQTAINIAAALSGGLKQSFGTWTKELQVGEAARSGVWAAVLAADGMSSAPLAADSWLRLTTGDDAVPDLTAASGPTVHVKRYPCCGRMHAALDLAAQLRAELGSVAISADSVRDIACVLNPRDISHIDRGTVRTAAEAKFSVQYGLAATLLRGPLGLADFDVAGEPAPDVTSLMSRVRIVADEQVPSFGAEIALTNVSGEVVRARAAVPSATSPAEIAAKFVDCSGRAGLEAGDAARFVDLVRSLDDVGDVRELVRALPRPARSDDGADAILDHRSPREGIQT